MLAVGRRGSERDDVLLATKCESQSASKRKLNVKSIRRLSVLFLDGRFTFRIVYFARSYEYEEKNNANDSAATL